MSSDSALHSYPAHFVLTGSGRVACRVSALLLLGASLAACGAKKETAPRVGTMVVDRRTIVVDAQATGAVEPINVIEVKSKASELITRMPVETGSQV